MAWIGLDCHLDWVCLAACALSTGLLLEVGDWRLVAFPAPISRTAIGHVAPAAFSVAKCSANCYAFASREQASEAPITNANRVARQQQAGSEVS